MNNPAIQNKRRIAVVTGSRAEFGLLRSVMHAIGSHPSLDLRVIAAGSHLLPPANTVDEIAKEFPIAATVAMQSPGASTRFDDAAALGRGITGFAEILRTEAPDVVLVLGDRIEEFAAAAAASVAGIRVAHMHGGDRAEGIADEAMRHAITKLAHLHFPATQQSALRIIAMGEDPQRVQIVGSPAIDDLQSFDAISDAEFAALGSPQIIVLLHPVGDEIDVEHERAAKLIAIAHQSAPTIVLHPNHDPGREGVMGAIEASPCRHVNHLHRSRFIGLLRRARVLVGNSSAGLIECAAIPIRAINIGRRQAGRERPGNVIDVPQWDYQTIRSAIGQAIESPPLSTAEVIHPYGEGRAGQYTAELLTTFDPEVISVAKQNAY